MRTKSGTFCMNSGEIRVGSGYDVGPMQCPYCRAPIEITESTLATNYVVIPKHEKPKRRGRPPRPYGDRAPCCSCARNPVYREVDGVLTLQPCACGGPGNPRWPKVLPE